MAPLKPPMNFKFRHFFSLVFIDLSSDSKSIVAKTNILLPPSLDFILTLLFQSQKKSRRLNGNLIVFQNIWATKLPCVETVMGANGKLSIMKCKVCSFVEKINKLFVSKFDGLHKHVGWWKTNVAKPNVKVWKYLMN
jgi:hypothetical protein